MVVWKENSGSFRRISLTVKCERADQARYYISKKYEAKEVKWNPKTKTKKTPNSLE